MPTILFTPYRPKLAEIMHRQFPADRMQSRDGRYQFIIGKPDQNTEVDFWVVQGKGVRHDVSCRVAPQNTIFLSTEPRTVLDYPNDYLRQFGLVCTCQPHTRGKNVVYGQPVLPWYVGYKWNEDADRYDYTLDYDTLSTLHPDKTRLLSVITSNKAFTRGHVQRIRFVERLKEHFGDTLDVFGRGFRPFDDKFDVLAPYKYHIVIENVAQDYYWTEKLSDTYLAECLPIYHGCTNVNDYFPSSSVINISMDDPDAAIAAIERAMANNEWERRHDAILEAKDLVLGKYNMFEYVASLCDRLDANAPKQVTTIHPCHSLHSLYNIRNYMLTRSLFKAGQFFHNLTHPHSRLGD